MDAQVCIVPPPQPKPAPLPPVHDRRGQRIHLQSRPHVYVRSGPHRGRTGVVVGWWRGAHTFLALAFFDARGELSNRAKPWRSAPDDIVRADRVEVVLGGDKRATVPGNRRQCVGCGRVEL